METEQKKSNLGQQERRTVSYTFSSMDDLTGFFADLLPPQTVSDVIAGARRRFVVRAGCSRGETKLQLIRKCESMLLKTMKESRPSPNL